MKFLERERGVLERYLPGLDRLLEERPFLELESAGSPILQLYREAKGPGLLIPRDYGGQGISALEAISIQRAIASRSPSLGIASTMHQFSVATLVEMAQQGDGMEGILLQAIAQQGLLTASGFAEGQASRGILTPTMQARRTEGGLIVNGFKKPCTMTWSMDLLTASVALPADSEGRSDLAVVLVPASAAGIERRKFWGNWVLGATESDELILNDVEVPERLIFYAGNTENLHPVQVSGFLWFELLVSASYLGVASALVERALTSGRGEPADRAYLGIELEGAMAALEGVAHTMMAGHRGQDQLAQVLMVRYAVEQAIERASSRAVDLLGGLSFIQSPEATYLLTATRGLTFHPPSRGSMSRALVEHLLGERLKVQ